MTGYPVHGELAGVTATTGVAVILYTSGGVVVRAIGTNEFLVVTDFSIFSETGGNLFLCADSKAAGRYLFNAVLDAKGGESRHYSTPYRCPRGFGLKLFGVNSNVDSVMVQGYITTGG